MLTISNPCLARCLRRSSALTAPCRPFVASRAVSKATEVVEGTEADVAKAEKKTNRAGLWFVAVAAAAIIGVLTYPSVVPPAPKPNIPHEVRRSAPEAAIGPVQPMVSPRESLVNRLTSMKEELAELRKIKKKDPMVDMKKKHLKDEIRMIESGLAKLDRS